MSLLRAPEAVPCIMVVAGVYTAEVVSATVAENRWGDAEVRYVFLLETGQRFSWTESLRERNVARLRWMFSALGVSPGAEVEAGDLIGRKVDLEIVDGEGRDESRSYVAKWGFVQE